ncbi:MAG TPA: hypothetical protein DEP84_22670, partial [Chloroflexi bacterium]|nr:hypothetical protein [Chloroflexota bacterium]
MLRILTGIQKRRTHRVVAPLYIAIEGVIGVGKTTLARLLQPEFEARLMLEVFEENPFLASFYADRERYAFQTQIFFLLSRYRQQVKIRGFAGRIPLLSDYLFAKDHLFARLNLAGDELATYETLYHTLAEHTAAPDLVIYLRASVDTLMARIAARDRPYERGMPREYIANLARAYDEFFASYTGTPLLVVDTDDLNVVTNAQDLAALRARVRAALGQGTYQQSLPLANLPPPLAGRPAPGFRLPIGSRLSELQAFHRTLDADPASDLFVHSLRLQERIGSLARELALAWMAAPRESAGGEVRSTPN